MFQHVIVNHVQIVLKRLRFTEARHHNSTGCIINKSNETVSSVKAEPMVRTSINLNQFTILISSWVRRMNFLRFSPLRFPLPYFEYKGLVSMMNSNPFFNDFLNGRLCI